MGEDIAKRRAVRTGAALHAAQREGRLAADHAGAESGGAAAVASVVHLLLLSSNLSLSLCLDLGLSGALHARCELLAPWE